MKLANFLPTLHGGKDAVIEQTVLTLIRLLLQEKSDLGLLCLFNPICPNILKDFRNAPVIYSMSLPHG